MAQAEGGLTGVHTGAEQLELEDGLQFADTSLRRRSEAEAALPHPRERAVILTELVFNLRQPGEAQRVVPIGVDLFEVVTDVEHGEAIDLETRLRRLRAEDDSLTGGGIGVAAECIRDVRNGALRANAVAGIVERRGDDGDAELARRYGDDSAADPALGRKSRVIQPFARVVIQTGRGHHGKHAGDLLRIHDLLAGHGIFAARRQRRRHRRQILRADPD
jgi:hypothetical protein